jgi:hypothetical protein
MKTLTCLLAVIALSTTVAAAQDLSGNANNPASPGQARGADVTGFRAPSQLGPTAPTTQAPPNLHPSLQPQIGGVFADGAKYGWVMISPGAPASYGIGEKYLTAPSPTQDLQHESGPAAHRQSGGLKLFSIEF